MASESETGSEDEQEQEQEQGKGGGGAGGGGGDVQRKGSKPRTKLTLSDKGRIAAESLRDGSEERTLRDIQGWCVATLGKKPSRSTICNVLKDRQGWIRRAEAAIGTERGGMARMETSYLGVLESRLATWVYLQQQERLRQELQKQKKSKKTPTVPVVLPPPPENEDISAQARVIAQAMYDSGDISEATRFKLNARWLSAFKRNYNIGGCGHCTDASIDLMKSVARSMTGDSPLAAAAYALLGVSRRDIYSLHEAFLYYRCLPLRVEFNRRASALRNQANVQPRERETIADECLTVMICCNSDGSDLRKPVVMGSRDASTVFADANGSADSFGVWYEREDFAMGGQGGLSPRLFDQWLRELNGSMAREGRSVWLITSNSPSHLHSPGSAPIELPGGIHGYVMSNVTVILTPDHPGSNLVNPLELGTAQRLKAQYRRRQLSWVISRLVARGAAGPVGVAGGLGGGHASLEAVESEIPGVRRAMLWIRDAWRCVGPATVRTSFNCTGLFPHASEDDHEAKRVHEEEGLHAAQHLKELLEALRSATGDHGGYYTAEELVCLPEEDSFISNSGHHAETESASDVWAGRRGGESEDTVSGAGKVTLPMALQSAEVLRSFVHEGGEEIEGWREAAEGLQLALEQLATATLRRIQMGRSLRTT